MNICENSLHTEQRDEKREPERLDDMVSDHYSRMKSLHELLKHVLELSISMPTDTENTTLMDALLVAAVHLAGQAVGDAERLDVNAHTYGYHLMAMPIEQLVGVGGSAPEASVDAPWQTVRAAMRVATGDTLMVKDIESALEMVSDLVDRDVNFADDLDTLTRIIEMRGYTIGWLKMPFNRTARVVHARTVIGGRGKTMATTIDARALLTAEEINLAASAMAAGLEGYLITALSHPANEGLQAK